MLAYVTGRDRPSVESRPLPRGRKPAVAELPFVELARPQPTAPAAKATAQTELPCQPLCEVLAEPSELARGLLRRVVVVEKLRPAWRAGPASRPLKPWLRRGLAESLADMQGMRAIYTDTNRIPRRESLLLAKRSTRVRCWNGQGLVVGCVGEMACVGVRG